MTELFRKLQERHVFRTALLYLGGAWAAMEAIGFFVDNYGWSRTALDVAVLLLVLGFPAALIIVWYHGERGRQAVPRTEASLLLTLAVLAAIGTYRLTTAVEVSSGLEPTGQPALTAADSRDLGERSVAVLPFVNSTGLDSLDWLGAGMSDMLTTNLARAGTLKVVSPQRLFELLRQTGYEESESIPHELAMDVAARSGARTMVYGSILGTPDDLALDAQLIDLRDGTVVAAERARGGDVFALADTVAERFTRRLAAEETVLAAGRPHEKAAMALTGDFEKLREYQASLRNALGRLDTDSVEARWQLVEMMEQMPGMEGEARGYLRDIVAARPDDPRAVSRLARLEITLGDLGAADTLIERFISLEKDPLASVLTSGRLLEQAGRHEEARSAYRKALDLSPSQPVALDHLARTWLREGDPEGARRELKRFTTVSSPDMRAEAHLLTGDSYAWEGRFSEAFASYGQAEAIGESENRPDLRAAGLESGLHLEWILDPDRGFSRINSAIWTLIDLGRGEKALDLVEAADRLYVRDADRLFPVEYHALLYAKGRVYELLDAPQAAVEAYSQLLGHWGKVIGDLPLLADAPKRLAMVARSGPAGKRGGGGIIVPGPIVDGSRTAPVREAQ